MNFNLLYYLISFLFPKKEEKLVIKQACKRLQDERDVIASRKSYPKVVKRIRNKKGKIKLLSFFIL